jgi:hypothetical protein
MKVSDLQDMLGMIRQMLLSAGSKGPANELHEFIEAFDPYGDMKANQLAAVLSDRVKKPARRKSSGKLAAGDVDGLIQEVSSLYEQAGLSMTNSLEIEEKTSKLQQLGKADVLRAAEAIGLQGMKSKSIAVVVAEIKKRIDARLGAGQRMGMIDVVVGDGR